VSPAGAVSLVSKYLQQNRICRYGWLQIRAGCSEDDVLSIPYDYDLCCFDGFADREGLADAIESMRFLKRVTVILDKDDPIPSIIPALFAAHRSGSDLKLSVTTQCPEKEAQPFLSSGKLWRQGTWVPQTCILPPNNGSSFSEVNYLDLIALLCVLAVIVH